jgi:hypothetical protein
MVRMGADRHPAALCPAPWLAGTAPTLVDAANSVPLGPDSAVQATGGAGLSPSDATGQTAGDETITNGGLAIPSPVLSKGLAKKMAAAGGVSGHRVALGMFMVAMHCVFREWCHCDRPGVVGAGQRRAPDNRIRAADDACAKRLCARMRDACSLVMAPVLFPKLTSLCACVWPAAGDPCASELH